MFLNGFFHTFRKKYLFVTFNIYPKALLPKKAIFGHLWKINNSSRLSVSGVRIYSQKKEAFIKTIFKAFTPSVIEISILKKKQFCSWQSHAFVSIFRNPTQKMKWIFLRNISNQNKINNSTMKAIQTYLKKINPFLFE